MTKFTESELNDFDFDEWLRLASEDQQAFESKRSEYIRHFLEQTPLQHRQRMKQVQWKLDMERKLSDSPMASCIKMYRQMWESLCGANGLSQQLNTLLSNWDKPSFYHNDNTAALVPIKADNVIHLKDFATCDED